MTILGVQATKISWQTVHYRRIIMTQVSQIRRGQIAILVVKQVLRKEGILFDENFHKKMEERAKEIGISVEELIAFSEPLIREVIDECFAEAKCL